jgi:hypothetical protein
MSAPTSSGGVYWTANGTVCNAEQWSQFLNQSPKHPNITCLPHGQTIGLALNAEASFLSFVAVVFVFILIGVCPTISVLVEFDASENRAEKCATL